MQGQRYVYDKNPNYVPRTEPPSAMSGGKVVKLDRVIFENIADEQTAHRRAPGRRDRLLSSIPHVDLLDDAAQATEHQGRGAQQAGHVGWARLNFLHPPFNNVEGAPGDAAPHPAGRT